MSGVGTPQSALAVGFTFPILDGVLTALRFYARRQQKNNYRVDDWLTIPAWVCVTGCSISLLIGVFKGVFVNAPVDYPDAVTPQEREVAQVTASLVIFWLSGNFFVKLAVIFFYRRIFVGRKFDIVSKTLVGLSIVWVIYALLSWFLYCGSNLEADFEGGWLACDPWGFDIQMGVFVFDSFIDFLLLILPIPLVWSLQLDWKRKILVTVVFGIGSFAFVAGLCNTIIQLTFLLDPAVLEDGGGANFFQGSGLLFSNWPAIEIGVGLLACNLPTLSPPVLASVPGVLHRGFRLSLSGLKTVAGVFLLRSRNSDLQTGSAAHPSQTNASRYSSSQGESIGAKSEAAPQKATKISRDGSSNNIALEELNLQGTRADQFTARGHAERYSQ